jgi:hypothetical protein
MASQAYYNGDWYECVTATAAGESPGTNPEKWSKLEIPNFAAQPIVEIAIGILLMADGQSDKRGFQIKAGEAALYAVFQRHRPRGDYRPLPVDIAQSE